LARSSSFAGLPEGVQNDLLNYGVKSLQNPWFGPTASIPAAALLWYLPHAIKISIIVPYQMFEYNNMTPRTTVWKDRVKNRAFADFLHRCEACHQNSFEGFALFSIAVLAARANKADPKVVAPLALKYVQLRVLYVFLYLAGFTPVISYARTIVWGMIMGEIARVFKAALDA
jgi:uncharacterized MAPEG superfamily protein